MGLYKVYDKFRRYWRQIHMLTIRDGWKKMAYIKKHGMFGAVGENCYFQSNILPAEPFLVYLHDNVAISAGVRIVTHSALNTVFNHEEKTDQMIASVTIRRQTWEQLRESLDDWRCGRMQNLFNPIPHSRFVEAIARLDAERERLTDSAVMEEKNHA